MNDVNDPLHTPLAASESSGAPVPGQEPTLAGATSEHADAVGAAEVPAAAVETTAGDTIDTSGDTSDPAVARESNGSPVAPADVPTTDAEASTPEPSGEPSLEPSPAPGDPAAESDAAELPAELVEAKSIIEAALLVAGEPVAESQLMRLFEPALDAKAVRAVLHSLFRDWADRSVVLVKVASGWRFQGRPSIQPYLDRLSPEKPPRYSRAVMETLAIIAYQQPVTRGDIEAIRGVAVSTNVIKTLEDRQWVETVGHRETPGRPALFATTKTFLDDLGLGSIAELPPLAELDASHLLEIPDATQQAAQAGLAIASPILAPAPDQPDGPAEPRPAEDSGGPWAGPPPVFH